MLHLFNIFYCIMLLKTIFTQCDSQNTTIYNNRNCFVFVFCFCFFFQWNAWNNNTTRKNIRDLPVFGSLAAIQWPGTWPGHSSDKVYKQTNTWSTTLSHYQGHGHLKVGPWNRQRHSSLVFTINHLQKNVAVILQTAFSIPPKGKLPI